MIKKIQSPLIITIGILLLLTGLVVAAPQGQGYQGQGSRGQGPGGHGPGGAGQMMGIFRDLDLTEDQRAQLRETVHEQMDGELGELMRNQRQERRDLRKLIANPATEESAIIDAVQANAVAAEQIAVARHRLTVSMFEILTEEQRVQALALIEERADQQYQPRGRGRRGGPPTGE